MNNLVKKIHHLSEFYFNEIVTIRNDFHRFPELSCKENRTSDTIFEFLKTHNADNVIRLADTGVVGFLKSPHKTTKTIAFRADMDALAISEKNEVSYKSKNDGVMHACGHDAHMASLLGAFMILADLKKNLTCNIKFIFQPSEETFPGGAIRMIQEGVLKKPEVSSVIGQHVYPNLEAGKVGFKSGSYMASTDEIYLTIKGKGGHGATPELNIDPVVIAAEILLGLQQIVSRNASPIMPSVLSFGRFIADGRTNIIPDVVEMAGTLRTFDEKWRESALKKISKISKNIAEAHNAKCEVRIAKGYPSLKNHELLTEKLVRLSEDFLGKENVIELEPRMTAEDFAYFGHHVPSCFYRLGVKSNKWKEIRNLHTATFDIDELSLKTGSSLLSWFALNGIKL